MLSDEFHHSAQVDGLSQHFRYSLRKLGVQSRCPRISTHDNYRYVRQLCISRNVRQEGDPIHDWHHEIEQDQLRFRTGSLNRFERAQTIFSREHRVTGTAENFAQSLS
jgi:hypothetical protein